MSPRTQMTLLSKDLTGGKRTLYVYRDNGSGNPDGSPVLQTNDKMTKEDLVKKLGPGIYLAMESGGNQNTASHRFNITASSGFQDMPAIGKAGGVAGLMETYQEIMITKQIVDAMKSSSGGDVDGTMDTVERIVKLLTSSRGGAGGGGNDVLDSFLEGADWGESGSGGPLGAALSALTKGDGAAAGGQAGELAKAIAKKVMMMDERQKITEGKIEAMPAQIAAQVVAELRAQFSPTTEVEPDEVPSPVETPGATEPV